MTSEPRDPSAPEPAGPAAQDAPAAAPEAAAPGPATPPASPPPGRRSFLRGLAGGVAGGVVAGGAAGAAAGYFSRGTPPDPAAAANAAAVTGRLPAVPFHGKYQAGILPGPSPVTAVISFDVTADDRASLTDLFQTLTDRARFLTAGGTAAAGRHRRAAVGLRGARADRRARRAHGDPRRRRDAVRRPLRARRGAPAPG